MYVCVLVCYLPQLKHSAKHKVKVVPFYVCQHKVLAYP